LLETRDQFLGRILKRAVTTPVSLALLAASGLCLFEPATWFIAVLGLCAEGVVVQLLVRDANFVRAVREDQNQADWRQHTERLERIRGTVDSETAERLARIQALQERLLQERTGADTLLASYLAPVGGEVAGLLDRCAHLAEKRHQLKVYLDSVRPAELQSQAASLSCRLEDATDSVARQLYQQALAQKRGELESYAAIRQAVERINGQLEAIECGLGNLLGRLIRLKSTDDAHSALAQRQVGDELTELNASLTALEGSVNEILTVEARR
jgi:hypothetical protein